MKASPARLAFIGFGEVGYYFARDLAARGLAISAFRRRRELAEERAREAGVRLCASLAEALEGAGVVLSCVWPHTALEAASEAGRLLQPGQLFADLNSISPATAARVETAVAPSGAGVAKVAIMAAATAGIRTPLLIGGPAGRELADVLGGWGFDVRCTGDDVRQPAAFKIARSYGLKAMLVGGYEMVRLARRYGIADEVIASAAEFSHWPGFHAWLDMSITSTAVHAGRRAQEMEEAMQALRECGLEDDFGKAIQRVFEGIREARLTEVFGEQPPATLHAMLDALEARQ